jgi:hypothetical protein
MMDEADVPGSIITRITTTNANSEPRYSDKADDENDMHDLLH